jgi:hypothetical protein
LNSMMYVPSFFGPRIMIRFLPVIAISFLPQSYSASRFTARRR